jgi:hypothetical protein
MVQALAGPLRPYIAPGDRVDLVSGNDGHPLSVPTLNRWAETLAPRLPPGAEFAAHMSGLEKVAEAARTLSPRFSSILLDWEPKFDPTFSWDFRSTLAVFDRFAAICRAAGRRAVAYPTGRPIQEADLAAYAWDYAEMARHVDEVQPQTQHWASLGPVAWARALARLRDQHARLGSAPRAIAVQITLGQGGNAIDPSSAVERYREALGGGIGRLYLWWGPAFVSFVQRFMGQIGT